MISETAIWEFDKKHCRPIKRSHTSIGGPTIPLKKPKSNRGKHWHWAGSVPHDTRMHRYGSLTSDQKAQWKALADTLNNGHSLGTPAPYSGAIVYMITNLNRRLHNLAYVDEPPGGDQPDTGFTGQIQVANTTPRTFVATLAR